MRFLSKPLSLLAFCGLIWTARSQLEEREEGRGLTYIKPVLSIEKQDTFSKIMNPGIPLDKIDVDFNAEKIRPRLGKRFQNYVSSGKRSEEFEIEKIRPRLGKRLLDSTSFGKRNTDYEVEKIRPRLGKRFSYKSPGCNTKHEVVCVLCETVCMFFCCRRSL